MPWWLSGGVVRCVVVLSLGWLLLASIAVAASGAVAQSKAGGTPPLTTGNVVQLDQLDPCTQDPLEVDARLTMTSIVHLNSDLIHTELIVTMYGSIYAGPDRKEERVAVADRVGFVRTVAVGLLEPYDLTLRMVERPTQLDTLFSARLQPFWDGTNESITVTETHLFCG